VKTAAGVYSQIGKKSEALRLRRAIHRLTGRIGEQTAASKRYQLEHCRRLKSEATMPLPGDGVKQGVPIFGGRKEQFGNGEWRL
jgi:hypothetical protein